MTDGTTTETGPLCVECEHMPAVLVCAGCGGDAFCALCFAAQHRKGTRRTHTPAPLPGREELFARFVQETAAAAAEDKEDANGDKETTEEGLPTEGFFARMRRVLGLTTEDDERAEDERCLEHVLVTTRWDAAAMAARAEHIPLRLTCAERKTLRLVEATLAASGYTAAVDAPGLSAARRCRAQVQGVCAVLAALLVGAEPGAEPGAGVAAAVGHDYAAHAAFLRHALEVARRYKVLNPDRLRTAYAPLVHVLQDSRLPHVRGVLECDLVAPLATVHRALAAAGALALLRDPALAPATAEVLAGPGARARTVALRAKRAALARLCARHASPALPRALLLQCVYSIADHHSFLRANRGPVDRCLAWLDELFPAVHGGVEQEEGKEGKEDDDGSSSLAIRGGADGARLTHSHAVQHAYVRQSLALWRAVQDDMARLWCLAEADLVAAPYVLQPTGQGVQRVQPAPRLHAAVLALVQRTQARAAGAWVGSSVVHLGDAQVPNALLFIDKYTQVPRILAPLVHVLDRISVLCSPHGGSADVRRLVRDTYGSAAAARRAVLGDFFRHAFDGSGADNFFDAGSCIDGRLTSAWNWCATLDKKPYYYLFLVAGFTGFDGEWK